MIRWDKMEYDEEGIVFYPNGDISGGELEKILHEAHINRYHDDKKIKCYERVRLSDPEAETPKYGRRVVKITFGELKRIYGRPYDPNEIRPNPAVLAIINGELYDMGS